MKPWRFIKSHRVLTICERGNFSVEFALVSVVLIVMLTGLFQYAAVIHQTMQLNQAARAGVEYAMTYPSDTTGIQQTIISSSAMNTTSIAVTVNQFCECPDGTAVACTGTCASGLQSNAFIRVDVTQPAKGPLQSSGFLSDSTVQASAVMRVR